MGGRTAAGLADGGCDDGGGGRAAVRSRGAAIGNKADLCGASRCIGRALLS